MGMGLFKRTYIVRKHQPQTIMKGYVSSAYKDVKMRLNIQPLSNNDLMALPEGERTVKRIKAFGVEELASADEYTGARGDRLFYRGFWYECKSSVLWDHTLLSHYQSDFVICIDQEEPREEVF